MTKILSQLLGAQEPDFRLGVLKLEQASGGKSHDIRLTADTLAMTRQKIAELGLDVDDTTGPELYHALSQKLAGSDKELARVLRLEPLEPNFLMDFADSIKKLVPRHDCFALKQSSAKKLFKANPPRKAMKALGYRSLDSFLKHESLAGLFASARFCESAGWLKSFVNSYRNLAPGDFEIRPLAITPLTSSRWQRLAASHTSSSRNTVFNFNEAGALALLPLEGYRPGMISAIFLLSLVSINEILAASSYLRLNQVKGDFGKLVANVAEEIPSVESPINGRQLSWRTVHNFLANSGIGFEASSGSDITLANPADTLADLSPALGFWRNTGHLAQLAAGEVVSLNPIDVALNYLNNLPFEQRVSAHFRHNLWHKFWQGYLQTEILGEKLLAELRLDLAGPELAPEFELAEGALTG